MLAITELYRRKLQFGLVTAVVALTAYLVIMVAGLGLGLNERAGTALLGLDGDYLAYASNANLSVIRSRLTDADVEAIRGVPGVEEGAPMGYTALSLTYDDGKSDTAATIGVDPDSFIAPTVVEGDPLGGPSDVLVDRAWVDLGVEVGDVLQLPAGFETRDFTVVGVVDEGYFFFQPAIYVTREAWQGLVHQGDAAQRPAASIVVLKGADLGGVTGEGWEVVSKRTGFNNIEGVAAQQSTVTALRYLGLLIGGMVIGVFFYVITLQKTALLGILKAIGASGLFLGFQSAIQVVIVSALGAIVAVALALVTEATVLSSDTVPIKFTAGTMITSSATVVLAGLVGSLLSFRQVAAIDPITAMQQQ